MCLIVNDCSRFSIKKLYKPLKDVIFHAKINFYCIVN